MANKKDRFSDDYLRFIGVGVEFLSALALFTLIGYFADRHWQIGPYGVLVGVITGTAVGTYLVIKTVLGEEQRKNGSND